MKIQRATKKPVTIDVVEYLGNDDQELAEWCGGKLLQLGEGFWKIEIPTLEGPVTASPGDWIAHGVAGEFYPIKPAIFEKTYYLA